MGNEFFYASLGPLLMIRVTNLSKCAVFGFSRGYYIIYLAIVSFEAVYMQCIACHVLRRN